MIAGAASNVTRPPGSSPAPADARPTPSPTNADTRRLAHLRQTNRLRSTRIDELEPPRTKDRTHENPRGNERNHASGSPTAPPTRHVVVHPRRRTLPVAPPLPRPPPQTPRASTIALHKTPHKLLFHAHRLGVLVGLTRVSVRTTASIPAVLYGHCPCRGQSRNLNGRAGNSSVSTIRGISPNGT